MVQDTLSPRKAWFYYGIRIHGDLKSHWAMSGILQFNHSALSMTDTLTSGPIAPIAITMTSMRLFAVLAFLIFSVINTDGLLQGESARRLEAAPDDNTTACPNPYGFYLAATVDVQTFYPSYCQEWEINEMTIFLTNHFDSYPAYDDGYGAIDVVPTTGEVCPHSERRLSELHPEQTEADDILHNEAETRSELHRKLRITGFVFKLASTCKLCNLDNADARRRLATTSPVTIRIRTDAYPEEFSYKVEDAYGETIYTSTTFNSPQTEYSQTLYLEPSTAYKIVMTDTYGDGICCFHGPGYLRVFVDETGTEMDLAYNDGNFGTVTSLWFTTPVAVVTSAAAVPSSVLIPKLEVKYSDYLSYFLQQSYQYNRFRCMYGKFPSVGVGFVEVSKTEALNLC